MIKSSVTQYWNKMQSPVKMTHNILAYMGIQPRQIPILSV